LRIHVTISHVVVIWLLRLLLREYRKVSLLLFIELEVVKDRRLIWIFFENLEGFHSCSWMNLLCISA
jgi:hypothetical protein